MAALTGYFGGKNYMSPWIYSYIPKDISSYIEVFGGSFAIYFNQDFSHCKNIVYNDSSKLQTNLINSSRNYQEMINEIDVALSEGGYLYCNSKDKKTLNDFYKSFYYEIKRSNFYYDMDFEIPNYRKALIHSFMINSSFNSCFPMSSGCSIFRREKLKFMTYMERIQDKYYQSKLDNITNVECMDFEDLIKKYDSESSYFYLDPPYKYIDGTGTHNKDYGSELTFGEEGHYRLFNLIKDIKARWSLSYYDFPELHEWYPKDKYLWVTKDYYKSSNNKTRGDEILIIKNNH